jgi:hypothetical protein
VRILTKFSKLSLNKGKVMMFLKYPLIAAATIVSIGLGLANANAATIVADGLFNDPASPFSFTTINAGTSFGTGNAWTVTNGREQC